MAVTEQLERVTFNQSRVKTFNICPKQYQYKFLDNLEPKRRSRPLYTGSWVHKCLETKYRDGDWKLGHSEYVSDWNKLFDEEREVLSQKFGPLPQAIQRIMRSYNWYYRNDGWKPVMIEEILEVETPLKVNGKYFVFKGRLDLVVEDGEGLFWLVDHKTTSAIPSAASFHAMDPQLMLYPWAAEIQFKIKLAGIIYNYVRSKPPTIPTLLKNGDLSRRRISTDYPTLILFLRQNDLDPQDFLDVLRPLSKRSPDFLRRYRLPREPFVTKQILMDTLSVVKRIDGTRRFTRTITRNCAFQCPYHDLCKAELNGFDATYMKKADFQIREEDYVSQSPTELEWESE